MEVNRRQFLQTAAAVGAGVGASAIGAPAIAQSRAKIMVG
jgi:phosphodiesterase/alkaline phosphatase D-like protein